VHREIARLLDERLRRLQLAWGATVLGVLAFAALGAWLSWGQGFGPPGPRSGRAAVVAGFGLALALGVIALDRRFHASGRLAARAGHPLPEHVLRPLTVSHLVLWSLAEVPAILGLVQLALGGSLRTLLLLCGVTLGVLAFLMPSRGRVLGLVEDALSRR